MRAGKGNPGEFVQNPILRFAAELAVVIGWLSILTETDAFYTPYLLLGILAVLAYMEHGERLGVWHLSGKTSAEAKIENSGAQTGEAVYKTPEPIEKGEAFRLSGRERAAAMLCAGLLSLAVVLANYPLLRLPSDGSGIQVLLYGMGVAVFMLIGGYFAGFRIMSYLLIRAENCGYFAETRKCRAGYVFVLSFAAFAGLNMVIFWTAFYPGILTPDSLASMDQILKGYYQNHHPFYFTMLVKLCYDLGMRIFGEINAAVAVYSCVQICFMAFCMSYVVMTLYSLRIAKKWVVLCFLWYLLMPYHIMFSFLMGRDMLFAGSMALFITALYRKIRGLGKTAVSRCADWALLVLGGFGICLMRSNGFFVFVLMCLALGLTAVRRPFPRGRCMLLICLLILSLSWVLKHPVLKALNVPQPDVAESFSIPIQQIARVVHDGEPLTEEQTEALEQFTNVEQMGEVYDWRIADNEKNLIRNEGGIAYLSEHKLAFIRLWAEIGMEHPAAYMKAWIDGTKGYWNAGYLYPFLSTEVYPNDYGIYSTVHVGAVSLLMNLYRRLLYYFPPMQIFMSIGLHTWILCAVTAIGFVKRRRGMIIAVPLFATLLSLLIATPVFSEFRYVYAVIVCLPMVMGAVMEET